MALGDREAISELLYRSCQYADAADTEGYLSLYVEEGSLDMGMGGPPLVGTEALRKFASARRPNTSVHVSGNHVISVEGDRATVESVVVVIGGADPGVRLAGRYSDELRKVDGSWRFVTRRLDPYLRPQAS